MKPILFSIGEIPIPGYGVLYLTAYLASIFMAAYLANRRGIRFWTFVDIGFMTAIGAEIGARLTFVIVEWERIASGAIGWKQFLVAGRVVLGGVALGLSVLIWQLRRHRLSVLTFSDIGLTGTTLGMGIGRLGCLLGGCCYGKPTDWWWGITFMDPLAQRFSGTPLFQALHPTQIIQSLNGFLMFAFFLWVYAHRRFEGQVAGVFLITTGATRFALEFLRGDPRGGAVGISTSQWVGVAGVAIGIAWLVIAARVARRAAG